VALEAGGGICKAALPLLVLFWVARDARVGGLGSLHVGTPENRDDHGGDGVDTAEELLGGEGRRGGNRCWPFSWKRPYRYGNR